MRTIISILSDQLIPNVLFIKQMSGETDKHIFLTTTKMEEKQKTKILREALGLKNDRVHPVVIDQNDPSLILQQLEGQAFEKSKKYIVNITGGTKMMSQMAWLHFSKYPDCQIYYWPVGKNYLEQLHPNYGRKTMENLTELDLKTYFAAHGYELSMDIPEYDMVKANQLMQQVTQKGDAANVAAIVNANRTDYLLQDKNFLMGGWFEAWLYQNIKQELALKDSEIGMNLKIKNRASQKKSESDNEIDVAFVYQNNLYIIESKVYFKKQVNAKKITDVIYKISSVRQSLGLQATAMAVILVSLGKNPARQIAINDISRMAQVKAVFSLEDFKNKQHFFERLKKIMSYE